MSIRQATSQSWLSILLTVSLNCGLLVPTASAQNPVIVSVGQPNIWSLEQAHYLLARMRRQSLDLESKTPGEQELDPNSVNISRLESLKSVLNVGVNFDQGIRFQNELLVSNARFNLKRRQDLQAKKDQLEEDSTRVAKELAILNLEKTRLKGSNADQATLDLKDAEIAQKTQEQAAIKSQLDYVTTEMGTLTAAPSGTPQTVTPPEPGNQSNLPNSLLDKLISSSSTELKDLLKNDPKLAASTILDNHIQMQYELIAKQLTLLRDEVGPGQRVVFLELPTSIYTTADKADNQIAQVWWHVNGYARLKEDAVLEKDLSVLELQLANHKAGLDKLKTEIAPFELKLESLYSELKDQKQQLENDERELRSLPVVISRSQQRSRQKPKRRTEPQNATERRREALKIQILGETQRITELNNQISVERKSQNGNADLRRKKERVKAETQLIDLFEDAINNPRYGPETKVAIRTANRVRQGGAMNDTELIKTIQSPELANPDKNFAQGAAVNGRFVRTIDIIPRQSSLNVNDVLDTTKSLNLAGAFSLLFGFGAKVSYQRQRELYEQYMHQEVYASGFGKGSEDFGWTFGPLPGTKRLAPGLRTTYAVLVVPEDAVAIQLEGRGCHFSRKEDGPPDWRATETGPKCDKAKDQVFTIPVPGARDTNFWITKVDYRQVEPGQRIVVSIRGEGFSSQIGVLVNGQPLLRSIGVARPELAIDKDKELAREVVDGGVTGTYELIGSNQIVMSFSLPKEFKGTPTITVVAPGRAIDINRISSLDIGDGVNDHTSWEKAAAMFGVDDPGTPLTISDFVIFPSTNPQEAAHVTAHLTGTSFDKDKDVIYINGKPTKPEFRTSGLYYLAFDMPDTDKVDVTLVQGKDEDKKKSVSKSFDNPFRLRIDHVTIINYKPKQPKVPDVLTIKLEGTGLGSATIVSPKGATLIPLSPNEAILEVTSPGSVVVITLKDKSGHIASTVVTPKTENSEK